TMSGMEWSRRSLSSGWQVCERRKKAASPLSAQSQRAMPLPCKYEVTAPRTSKPVQTYWSVRLRASDSADCTKMKKPISTSEAKGTYRGVAACSGPKPARAMIRVTPDSSAKSTHDKAGNAALRGGGPQSRVAMVQPPVANTSPPATCVDANPPIPPISGFPQKIRKYWIAVRGSRANESKLGWESGVSYPRK